MKKMHPVFYIGLGAILLLFFLPLMLSQVRASDSPRAAVYFRPVTTEQLPTIPKMKRAILAVENTPWNGKGAAGERTSYQIMPEVWRDWSLMPFEEISHDTPEVRAEVDIVVSKQLAWIRSCVEKQGYAVNPYTMALVWKAGLGRFMSYRTRRVDRDYATRAANIYGD
jgi:hypothetical protein